MLIGILGAGQLGRMLALAGLPIGLRFRFLDPAEDAVAAHVGELIVGDFDDPAALARFARGLSVCTFEFENVPAAALRAVAAHCPVWPPVEALETGQDRLAEKTLFQRLGLSVHPFAPASTRDEFAAALRTVGLPAVAKTRRMGYDGKGQAVIRTPADADAAWEALGAVPLLVEALVPFDRELSVIGVRARSGEHRAYPLVENVHDRGILRLSRAPADVTPALQAAATAHSKAVMDALGYVGVLTIEFFDAAGTLLANEMAPRVHNSGHWTIEAARTSQFENHLRALADLPLGDTTPRGPSAMVNLIGACPPLSDLLRVPGAHPHLYGKGPREGRKVGHVTITGDSATLARSTQAVLALATEHHTPLHPDANP